MAAKEMYDYLSSATPDITDTLSVMPHEVIVERGNKKGVVHWSDSGRNERILFSKNSDFTVELVWEVLSNSEAAQIIKFYHNTQMGCGVARSFLWIHPTDGHTYVVHFIDDISRSITPSSHYGVPRLKLQVVGYYS